MTKVFLGGSRHISRLNSQIDERLDAIVNKQFPVLVGDANGADKAIQRYLNNRGYRNVEIFCVGSICRNNIGDWPIRSINSNVRERDFSFYSAKDRVMTAEATIGLMVWDGKSVGTLLNVWRLLDNKKFVVVYASPEKNFWELKNFNQWEEFITHYDARLRWKVEQKAALESHSNESSQQTTLGF